MKLKKTLASLIIAGGLALGNNAKAGLLPIEKLIPDSYSYSGSVLDPELAVDGDFNTYAESFGKPSEFTITEIYLVPEGTTSADWTSKFSLGKYILGDIDYSVDGLDWSNLYEGNTFDGNPLSEVLTKTLNPFEDFGKNFSEIDSLRFRNNFISPYGFSGQVHYNESKVNFIPEIATIALLGLGGLCLIPKRI